MSETGVHLSGKRLRTPRAAALAGIIFALLLSTSYILIRLAIPSNPVDGGIWLEERAGSASFALSLVPFAGIAFLWFMGVIRDRLGYLEDQFFSTVFYGSGILFLAMTFISAALAGAILSSYAIEPSTMIESGLYTYARQVMHQVLNIFGIRMAGVFMFSLATIWIRTGIVNRYLAYLTYISATILLLVISLSLWIILVFPVWVFVISVYILLLNLRMRPELQESD
jgi:hypothetical protein